MHPSLLQPKSPSPLRKRSRNNQSLGLYGENLALTYLISHGFTLVARNVRSRYGEIDLIVRKDNRIIFAEVKTRIGIKYGSSLDAITSYKLRSLTLASKYYLLSHPKCSLSPRIDAVCIQMNDDKKIQSVTHIENISG